MGKKTKLGKFRKDKFYKLAKETGFRSRAAFKLIQLNRKFGFLQQSQVCIDLCAAPGGWMQVAKQNMPVSSIVIGVDLYPIRQIPGCISLVEDITTDKCKTAISRELKTWKADVILHDGAPNVGKNWLYDAYQQICLTLSAVKLSTNYLRSGGWFVTKVFRSKDYNALLWVLKQLFKKIHATKPSASRKESAEIFVVCQGYLAPHKIDPKLLDSKYVFEELELETKTSSLLHPEKQKRVKAEGYSGDDFSMRKELDAVDLMQNENALSALQGVSHIKVEEEAILKHPKTTKEILECCKDIKVLGRKDLKGLLNWWKHVRADLYAKPKEDVEEVELVPKKELTQEELEEAEFEELVGQIDVLAKEEESEAKRKRKKVLKERSKLNEKLNLKMLIKGDEGPTEAAEEDIFSLKQISTKEELENLQNAAPDIVVEDETYNGPQLPKYKKYEKNDEHLDDDGRYNVGSDLDEKEGSIASESDYEKDGLGLSDDEQDGTGSKKKRKVPVGEHPLIKPCDYRDKDTKRKQRVQFWFEKDNLQKLNFEDDENIDLDHLANEYKKKGVEVLGENNQQASMLLGKKAKRRARHQNENDSASNFSSDSESENNHEDNKVHLNGDVTTTDNLAKPKVKKIRLTEEELALGAMMIKGRKTKRDLLDGAWNRYAFNDDNLPEWFVQDEEVHMRKQFLVPKELTEEYEKKVRELNVRPLKKVMEAKARKRKRVIKRLAKAKKKAENILENQDASSQEKMRQLRNLYKKAEGDKKKEVTYVVARKHIASKRVRRPPGVKGRYKVVDPRMKKDKRATKQNGKGKKGKVKGQKTKQNKKK